jgi:hypothetical protein
VVKDMANDPEGSTNSRRGVISWLKNIVYITSTILLPTNIVLKKDFGSLYREVSIRPLLDPLFFSTSTLSLFAVKYAISLPEKKAERIKVMMTEIMMIDIQ